MKPSFQTGEFWMYLLFGLLAFYLNSKGIKLADVEKQGADLVNSLGGFSNVSLVVFPALFAIKQSLLKWQKMKFDTQIEIAKVQAPAAAPQPTVAAPAQAAASPPLTQ